jgi:hypothetical protein
MIAAGVLSTACGDPGQRTALGSAPTVGLNEAVDVGSFAFTVTTVELAQPKIGYRAAEGTFVVVDITARNIGDGLRSVYCQNQVLKDLAGKRFDNGVTIGPGDDMVNIKPGNRAKFRCAFDVPVGTLAGAVEVHDTAYSAGATVKVLSVR